jgi:hypothetical protein
MSLQILVPVALLVVAPGRASVAFMDAGEERNLILFRRDERGRVTSLIERRKFNDLLMRRVENEK